MYCFEDGTASIHLKYYLCTNTRTPKLEAYQNTTKSFQMQNWNRFLLSITLTKAEVAQLPLLLFWIILCSTQQALCHAGRLASISSGRSGCGQQGWHRRGTLGDTVQQGCGANVQWEVQQLFHSARCWMDGCPSLHHALTGTDNSFFGGRTASLEKHGWQGAQCPPPPSGLASGLQPWVRVQGEASPALQSDPPRHAGPSEAAARPRDAGTGRAGPPGPLWCRQPKVAGQDCCPTVSGRDPMRLPKVTAAPLSAAPKPRPSREAATARAEP